MIMALISFALTAQSPFAFLESTNKTVSSSGTAFYGFLPPSQGQVKDQRGKMVHLRLETFYFPEGFDTSDFPQFFAEVEIPNARYKVFPPADGDIKVIDIGGLGRERGLIQFDLKAFEYPEAGEPALARKLIPIQMRRRLDVGTYEVKYHPEVDRLQDLGILTIAPASPKHFFQRDERIYPEVRSARVVFEGNALFLRVEGPYKAINGFQTKCYVFDKSPESDEKITLSRNVFVVIAGLKVETDMNVCRDRPNDYVLNIPIPPGWEKNQRYLFFIPTDNGDAFYFSANLGEFSGELGQRHRP